MTEEAAKPIELLFEHGTLVVPSVPEALASLFKYDERAGAYRAPASSYRDVVVGLRQEGIAYVDRARAFEPLPLPLLEPITPFPYQQEALDAWIAGGSRGIVVLPTGAGKTLLAVLALSRTERPALIVVPTLDLVHQWRDVLAKYFATPIGMVTGTVKDRQSVTITTYDSAVLQMEFSGNRYGLLVFDECHHLPSESYRFIAEASIAPFRLGLTATLERADGGERLAQQLIGPVSHAVGIEALEGKYLAPYETQHIEVELSEDELARYQEARSLYLDFVRSERIAIASPDGWRQFIMRSQRNEVGRKAFAAYREQRRIALASEGKRQALWEIVMRHRHERIIVFTEDNETVHRLSRKLLMPAITHLTGGAERQAILRAFSEGRWPVLLTSKVLNEGVDVPEANVGVVLSGNASVREHVQRLGRILRRREGKRAVLYEICSAGTAESSISERRRQHRAYQKGSDEKAE